MTQHVVGRGLVADEVDFIAIDALGTDIRIRQEESFKVGCKVPTGGFAWQRDVLCMQQALNVICTERCQLRVGCM